MRKFSKKSLRKNCLVVFGTEWCEPVKAIEHILEGFAKNGYNIFYADIEKTPEYIEEYQIRALPTLIYFKDGKVHKKHTGQINRVIIEKLLNS